ncbi:MAG: hypothetical protein R6U12_10745 [Thioalkalivibrio sp.]
MHPGADPAMAGGWWLDPAAVRILPGFLLWRGRMRDGRLRVDPPREGRESGCPMPAREPGEAGEGNAEAIG